MPDIHLLYLTGDFLQHEAKLMFAANVDFVITHHSQGKSNTTYENCCLNVERDDVYSQQAYEEFTFMICYTRVEGAGN